MSQQPTTIYLVSDATGTTLQGLASACIAQFEGLKINQRIWPLIRSERQIARVLDEISRDKGPVFFTFVDPSLRNRLQEFCESQSIPYVSVLDPMLLVLSTVTGHVPRGIPGLQHALDEGYFKRIDAIDYAMGFDDGQQTGEGLEQADVILVGVSRTSKTPTCVFLARYGIRAANIPYVPGSPIPDTVLALKEPLFVGLVESPDRLIQLRATRLRSNDTGRQMALFRNTYLDPEAVEAEVEESRRFFRRQGWPIIDVTKRSIEETAAEIQLLLQNRKKAGEPKP